RCQGVADVIAATKAARAERLTIAVRGGGHSVPGFGTADGALVVDLSQMRGIRVDPASKTVRAEGGCTWGDFNHATHAFGLATTGGIISTTGIAGLTLGGGIGYLTRGCGLSLDNLASADVVLPDGSFVTATTKSHEDLFWALRGGGLLDRSARGGDEGFRPAARGSSDRRGMGGPDALPRFERRL